MWLPKAVEYREEGERENGGCLRCSCWRTAIWGVSAHWMPSDAGAGAEGRPKGTAIFWRDGHLCPSLVGQQDLQVPPMGPSWVWLPSPHGTRRAFQPASSPVVPVPLKMQGFGRGCVRGDQEKEQGCCWRKEMLSLVRMGRTARRKRGRESGCLMCVWG